VTTPRDTPDDGRPSVEARVRLAGDLRDQLASSRLAWEAALLRSDAALASGDPAEVQAALDDHRSLLDEFEERLGAVVAGATTARDLEVPAPDHAPAEPPPTGERSSPARRGAVALLGTAAAVLLVAGALASELPLEADLLNARTEAPEVESAPPDRPASAGPGEEAPPRDPGSDRVPPPGVPPTAPPGGPAVSTPSEPGAGSDRETTDEPASDREVAASQTRPTEEDGPTSDRVPAPERRHTDRPRRDEASGSLPDLDGVEGQGVSSPLRAPFAELPQDPVAPAPSPVASEPPTGLG
jgi:hypothetical protein